MNFDLDIPQRGEFQEALLSAYPNLDRLKMLSRTALGERLEEIVSLDGSLTDVIFELVEWVNTQSSESRERLVLKAYVSNPGNERMQSYLDRIGLDRCSLSAQGFACDVFISHAEDADPAWVKKMVRGLRERIVRKLQVPVRLVTSQADSNPGQQSGLFLALITPGYVASPRCAEERRAFSQGRDVTNKTFLVLRTPGTPIPQELERARSYPFYQEGDYYTQMDTLGRDLSEALERCLNEPVGPAPARTTTPAPPREPEIALSNAIYLAEATDDLYREREEVRAYLKQAGLKVLPEVRNSRSPEKFAGEMDVDLQQCALYVQLLGPKSDASRDLPLGYAGLQYDRAIASKKPMLLWRRPDLNLADIAEADYRRLVESPQVRAEGLENFKRAVVETIHAMQSKPEPSRPASPAALPWVFVDYARDDETLVKQVVRARLAERRFPHSLPLFTGDAMEIQQFLKKEIEGCDVLLLVYGDVPADWVTEQLRCSLRFRAGRGEPLRAKALYDGPPQSKPELPVFDPELKSLSCRMDAASLDAFLDDLVRQFSEGRGQP